MQENAGRRDVAELLKQLESLAAQVAEAGTELDEDSAAQLKSALGKVNRAVTKAGGGKPAAAAVSARQQVIDALTELGVPASPQLVAGFHQARFGSDLNPRVMASLRRDELRALQAKSSQRSVLVVPALTPRLAPARGMFALSTWPDWLRIVGPLSTRVDNLRVLLTILNLLDTLHEQATQAHVLRDEHQQRSERLEALLWRYGASLPGIDRAGLDLTLARAAATEELQMIEAQDRRERDEAAARLGALDTQHRLFGAALGIAGGQ
ncbi:hypothetical protein Lesp02_02680 [Lentzea sp. NBRC 105346]|uniref:hypothetical protein n=1 Tax=Lentzea sp. NBRC 105346 TaxID=3032205 RepID=UPI00249FEBE0|nr:hypothetical protein [Lentzea sp. NBRC 105346]GLZ28078.1 hypothetical protein Lesp02_02680 [Lentzea sp. NBRC 105346]